MINMETIKKVEKVEIFGTIIYSVTLKNDMIISVPCDPDNTDYPIALRWLEENQDQLNKGDE